MKKILILIIMTFLLGGCYDYNELNNIAIVSGVGIDYKDDKYSVTFEIISTKKSGDSSGSTSSYTVSSEADTITEAFLKIGNSLDKVAGKVYDYIDYYAMIRIPMELFNVKTVIYEPIYMSNINDFNWYWTNKKWIDVTEMKIEEYVNYLGKTYNSDNSSCI